MEPIELVEFSRELSFVLLSLQLFQINESFYVKVVLNARQFLRVGSSSFHFRLTFYTNKFDQCFVMNLTVHLLKNNQLIRSKRKSVVVMILRGSFFMVHQ